MPDTMDYKDAGVPTKRWAPNTSYAVGTQVIAPTNEIVDAKTTHVSGATYVASNWDVRTATSAAIASPTAPGAAYAQAEAQSMKTAVDAIRDALTANGITL